jgi:glyoxylase-like metal-dependent hydrolase (beta-lactamase superfamily II)
MPESNIRLPPGMQVIIRDWLNANHVVFDDAERTVLIDSGYGRDTGFTLERLRAALRGRPLDWLVNTHCHSDHMGGNARVRDAYHCRLSIPIGEAPLIKAWDDESLWLEYADQRCERFEFDDTIAPGGRMTWGGRDWLAIAAPGHDMGALMFHCEEEHLLISGDALWENGFGVLLPGSARRERLAAARETLETISSLNARIVIPGHGAPFTGIEAALERSFQRLAAFERDETRMARHVLKVMFVFSLMDRRRLAQADVPAYLASVPLYRDFNARYFQLADAELAQLVVGELERSGAVRKTAGWLVPA